MEKVFIWAFAIVSVIIAIVDATAGSELTPLLGGFTYAMSAGVFIATLSCEYQLTKRIDYSGVGILALIFSAIVTAATGVKIGYIQNSNISIVILGLLPIVALFAAGFKIQNITKTRNCFLY